MPLGEYRILNIEYRRSRFGIKRFRGIFSKFDIRNSMFKCRGFTLAELMVSITILILISLAVATDITRTRYQEELASSARLTVAAFRDLQARALSATSVLTCNNGGVDIVCEYDDALCGFATCGTKLVPIAVGAHLETDESVIETFAEVDLFMEDRRMTSARENLGQRKFAEGNAGSNPVTITSITAGVDSLSEVTVTFDRQNGNMRINACDDPAGAPSCGGSPEPTTLAVTITHARLGRSETIRLNTLTGRIDIE
jgi:prepilin-type N-terminal cleavage/methylation domain-containing protein